MAGAPTYRAYDPSLNLEPIEYLDDADEYYQDILESLKGMTETTVFITGWLIKPGVLLNGSQTLEQTIATILKDPKSTCYILWNATMTGPNPKLIPDIEKFRTNVKSLSGVTDIDSKLKVIISIDPAFEPGWQLTLPGTYPLTMRLKVNFFGSAINNALWQWGKSVWQDQFANVDPSKYRNLNQPTLGAHHQKTITFAGKKNGQSVLVGYSGMDLGEPNGIIYHDGGVRVKGDLALGLLSNFIERWNCELNNYDKIVLYGVASRNETLNADDYYTAAGNPLANALRTRRTLPKLIQTIEQNGTVVFVADAASCLPWKKEIRQDYLDLIGSASQWLFIENQYFRHPEITNAVKQALDNQPALRVTIVMPSYSEEIGLQAVFFELRDQYVQATTQTQKDKLLTQARKKGNLIHPFNKVTLLLQVQCLADLVNNARVRIWFPHGRLPTNVTKIIGTPYIHTKLMVVDNTALFTGSANLNGRSLDGFADSELNSLLTDQATIDRILNRMKWQNEPDSETANNYLHYINGDSQLTYYAKHNLFRYRQTHLEIDRVFGAFPIGRAAIKEYFTDFTKDMSARENLWMSKFTAADLDAKLDSLAQVVDLNTFDWGPFLTTNLAHFL